MSTIRVPRSPARPLRTWLLALAVTAGSAAVGPVVADVIESPDGTENDPATLVIGNRPILELRAEVLGASPAERAEAIEDRARLLVDRGGPLRLTTRPVGEGILVEVDGRPLMRVMPGDLDAEAGESLQQVAAAAAARLDTALGELREAQQARTLLPAAGRALFATALLAVLAWATWRAYRALRRRLVAVVQRRTEQVTPSWFRQVFGPSLPVAMVQVPLRIVALSVLALAAYEWVAFVLKQFPYTRPWGETLASNLIAGLGQFGGAILRSLPNLLFVLLIVVMARMVVRLVRAFFRAVAERRIEVGWFDETTARPTERLVTIGIWLLAMVAAYPYFPGSGSEAFKGIGVFVGLMLSIGSSGIVNQAVSGLMLMYTRSIRPGEWVQIGETEGAVTAIGFLNTRLRTLRQEEISIPNAVIASSVTRNFSRLAAEGGLRVATKVTIGYDTPWRQVEAMLAMAAQRTSLAAPDAKSKVLQSALQDFYVEYTLVVPVADPARRADLLDELHGHIQDVFNEHGVQIMSPNYEADPAQPKLVPPDEWYRSPATK